ncbi:transposase [Rhodococcus sp. PvR099]|nr:transposase [Rhodococcus sp. PvR099]
MVEGIIYRCRCGIAWRDLPEVFGPWGRDEQQWLARSVADRKILVIAMEERHVSEWEAFNAAGDARQEHCEAFRNTRPVTSKGSPARVTVTAVKQKETKA